MSNTSNAFMQLVLSGQKQKQGKHDSNDCDTTHPSNTSTNCASITKSAPCRPQGARTGEWSDAVLPAEAAFSYDTEEYSGWRLRLGAS